MHTLTLTAEEAELTSTAVAGLAAQIAAHAERLHHGRAHLDACAKVGTLRAIARRLDASQSRDAQTPEGNQR